MLLRFSLWRGTVFGNVGGTTVSFIETKPKSDPGFRLFDV